MRARVRGQRPHLQKKVADRVDHMQRARVHARHRVNAALILAGQTLPD